MLSNLLKMTRESLNEGNYDQALTMVNETIDLNPSLASAWHVKGVIFRNLGQLEESIECFDTALEFNPNLDKALCDKGISLLEIKCPREALIFLERAIKAKPTNACAWRMMGDSFYKLKRKREAIDAFKKAEELGDSEANSRLHLIMASLEVYGGIVFDEHTSPRNSPPRLMTS